MLTNILDYAIKVWASDIHITEWRPIFLRINWDIRALEWNYKVDNVNIKVILLELLKDDKVRAKDFLANKDIDFAYVYKNIVPFRVNWFFKLWSISFVLRRIADKPWKIEDIFLLPWVEKFTRAKQGLILVTWPTWSGKSTTMVALLERINETRKEHIITIEDPIEFVFKDNKSIFSQREIWNDTKWFHSSLRAAMREDPNIIMVWELRDKETVESAVELAETWHLVLSTLHTSWSVQSITRLISFFPPEIQWQAQLRLGDNLFWVISQRLIKRADREWRIWIFEVMFCNPAIRNLIRSWNLTQIDSNIETWKKDGMINMKVYADNLAKNWVIKKEDYINYFRDDM